MYHINLSTKKNLILEYFEEPFIILGDAPL